MNLDTISPWTATSIPSSTTLSSISTGTLSAVRATLSSVVSQAATETNTAKLSSLASIARGAQATLTIISAEKVIATATDSSVLSAATSAWFDATLNLTDLESTSKTYLGAPNYIYFVVYLLTFFYTLGMCVKSRYHWYNITFLIGLGLELVGFIGRVLLVKTPDNTTYFIMQYAPLTIAPAFLMGGIYFLFAQLVVIHGRQFSYLKPMWYSYFFIASDIISIMIQAGGGSSASSSTTSASSTALGTNLMIAGIVFQVVAMTVFLFFWFDFLVKVYFKYSYQTASRIRATPITFLKMLFNVPSIRQYRFELEQEYNPQFADVRQRRLFSYFPMAITISVLAIYIRCVYRVVELAQGFDGYLFNHEVYLMVLDALMVSIAAIMFVPFHPFWALGSSNVIRLATIKKNKDAVVGEKPRSASDEESLFIS